MGPADTRHWPNAGLMLSHRLRRWETLAQHWFNVLCLLREGGGVLKRVMTVIAHYVLIIYGWTLQAQAYTNVFINICFFSSRISDDYGWVVRMQPVVHCERGRYGPSPSNQTHCHCQHHNRCGTITGKVTDFIIIELSDYYSGQCYHTTPANVSRWAGVFFVLVRCRRRWANIWMTFGRRLAGWEPWTYPVYERHWHGAALALDRCLRCCSGTDLALGQCLSSLWLRIIQNTIPLFWYRTNTVSNDYLFFYMNIYMNCCINTVC